MVAAGVMAVDLDVVLFARRVKFVLKRPWLVFCYCLFVRVYLFASSVSVFMISCIGLLLSLLLLLLPLLFTIVVIFTIFLLSVLSTFIMWILSFHYHYRYPSFHYHS